MPVNPKTWFTTIPEPDPDEDAYYEELERRQKRWFNQCYEHSGTRVRLIVGDIMADGERECGGRAAVEFAAELSVCQEDVPEFHLDDSPNAVYDIHTFTAVAWRWGVYLSIRGRIQ